MKHRSVSADHMQVVSEKLSICEVLRQAYRLSTDPKVMEKLRLACGMAKAMSERICQLEGNDTWFHDFWDENKEE